ncbi:MAG: hypothetical protein Ct9H90mP13_03980 [Pseudomonadota bacterium]|nr:MAG: hypothetical protein Ct9H90mP13_03980 [Pseudomonadota bacterium]
MHHTGSYQPEKTNFRWHPSHEGEGYIDVNIIPEIAMNRVEILKEGATSYMAVMRRRCNQFRHSR